MANLSTEKSNKPNLTYSVLNANFKSRFKNSTGKFL